MQNQEEKMDIQAGTKLNDKDIYVQVLPDGPYEVHGKPRLVQLFIMGDAQGKAFKYKEGKEYPIDEEHNHLCRCGLSKNTPYCDGSHHHAAEHGIDLTETASMRPSLKTAKEIGGPVLSLTDDRKLCAYARFCDNWDRIWNEVRKEGAEHAKHSKYMAHHCPAGRLIVWDPETGKPVEEEEEPMIGIIEDMPLRMSGPLALRGGIPVKRSDGKTYEVRNRQTLCRCGRSVNKPFCNGAHASMHFHDGLPEAPEEDGKEF